MREFVSAVRELPAVAIPAEEVINSMGVAAGSDALQVSRSACVIALQRSAEQVRPLLHNFFDRLRYVVERFARYASAECPAERDTAPSTSTTASRSASASSPPSSMNSGLTPELEALMGPTLWEALEQAFASQVRSIAPLHTPTPA